MAGPTESRALPLQTHFLPHVGRQQTGDGRGGARALSFAYDYSNTRTGFLSWVVEKQKAKWMLHQHNPCQSTPNPNTSNLLYAKWITIMDPSYHYSSNSSSMPFSRRYRGKRFMPPPWSTHLSLTYIRSALYYFCGVFSPLASDIPTVGKITVLHALTLGIAETEDDSLTFFATKYTGKVFPTTGIWGKPLPSLYLECCCSLNASLIFPDHSSTSGHGASFNPFLPSKCNWRWLSKITFFYLKMLLEGLLLRKDLCTMKGGGDLSMLLCVSAPWSANKQNNQIPNSKFIKILRHQYRHHSCPIMCCCGALSHSSVSRNTFLPLDIFELSSFPKNPHWKVKSAP